MTVGVDIKSVGDGFITDMGILMVEVNVVEVAEAVVFGVLGVGEVNWSDVVDSSYKVNTSLRQLRSILM